MTEAVHTLEDFPKADPGSVSAGSPTVGDLDLTGRNVLIVEDSLGSPAVTDCVLAQMRGWKFPAIEQGVVTFKTPFVFTPPE